MIDFTALMQKAEGELLASEALMRATKAGILFGVLTASLQKYAQSVTNADVLRLMEILTRDGHLLDMLPALETHVSAAEPLMVRDDAVHMPAAPPLPPEEQQARDEDIRIMRARGFREEEIQAILALGGLANEGEVEHRSDEDLARYEEEKRNPFPGAPQGKPLDAFTVTEPEDLPADLKAAMS
jgi:hypothetical protein